MGNRSTVMAAGFTFGRESRTVVITGLQMDFSATTLRPPTGEVSGRDSGYAAVFSGKKPEPWHFRDITRPMKPSQYCYSITFRKHLKYLSFLSHLIRFR